MGTPARLAIVWLSATAGLLTTACAQDAPPSGRTSSAPTTAPAKAARTPRDAVPIVYDLRLHPVPLTGAETDEILDYAEPLAPQGRRVWFIHVPISQTDDGKRYWRATVYYTPDTSTERIRKGRAVGTGSMRKRIEAIVRKLDAATGGANHDDPYRKYVQVSLAGRPFGKDLQPEMVKPVGPAGETRGQTLSREDLPLLKAWLWPFDQPAGFTDEEIVSLSDFARTSPARHQADEPGTIRIPGTYDGKEPIHRITRGKDGVVEVWSGAQQDSLAGAGTFMKCIKKIGKWFVLGTGTWNS